MPPKKPPAFTPYDPGPDSELILAALTLLHPGTTRVQWSVTVSWMSGAHGWKAEAIHPSTKFKPYGCLADFAHEAMTALKSEVRA